MPENPKSVSPPQQDLKAVRSETFLRLYTNAANMEVTPWDFRLIFGELKKSDNQYVIEQSVEIIMSPQHAKALADVLIQNVREYEKNVGEIKLPKAPDAVTNASADPTAKA